MIYEKRRSVTLVELVLGISILILISTITFSTCNNLNNYKVNSFLKQLVTDIRYIKRVNKLGNNKVYLYFTSKDGCNGYILRENGENTKSVFLPKESKLVYSRGKILFTRYGTFYHKGTTIVVRNDNKYKTITITPISGRILLKEGIYEE